MRTPIITIILASTLAAACSGDSASNPTPSATPTPSLQSGGLVVAMTLPELVDQSQLIVVGELVALRPLPGSTTQDLGTIRVEETLLTRLSGPSQGEAALLVPSRSGLAVSTAVYYTVGQRGVWFLRADPSQDQRFLADHPQRLKPAGEADQVRAYIRSRP